MHALISALDSFELSTTNYEPPLTTIASPAFHAQAHDAPLYFNTTQTLKHH